MWRNFQYYSPAALKEWPLFGPIEANCEMVAWLIGTRSYQIYSPSHKWVDLSPEKPAGWEHGPYAKPTTIWVEHNILDSTDCVVVVKKRQRGPPIFDEQKYYAAVEAHIQKYLLLGNNSVELLLACDFEEPIVASFKLVDKCAMAGWIPKDYYMSTFSYSTVRVYFNKVGGQHRLMKRERPLSVAVTCTREQLLDAIAEL